jgi:hypothetical protein
MQSQSQSVGHVWIQNGRPVESPRSEFRMEQGLSIGYNPSGDSGMSLAQHVHAAIGSRLREGVRGSAAVAGSHRQGEQENDAGELVKSWTSDKSSQGNSPSKSALVKGAGSNQAKQAESTQVAAAGGKQEIRVAIDGEDQGATNGQVQGDVGPGLSREGGMEGKRPGAVGAHANGGVQSGGQEVNPGKDCKCSICSCMPCFSELDDGL